MGTRLSAIIHLRDKFGNACAWLDDDDDDDVDPNRGANDIQYQLRNDIRNQLTATILQRGIALSATETKPNKLRIDPRDESLGVYEAKHVLARAGRFVITIQLNGNERTRDSNHGQLGVRRSARACSETNSSGNGRCPNTQVKRLGTRHSS